MCGQVECAAGFVWQPGSLTTEIDSFAGSSWRSGWREMLQQAPSVIVLRLLIGSLVTKIIPFLPVRAGKRARWEQE